MKAISIRQPYVEQILAGIKTREFRSRSCKIRGRVLIHASRSVHADYFDEVVRLELPCGGIIGSVEIVGCEAESRDANDKITGYAWLLSNPIRFLSPVPYAGKVGWFEVPDVLFVDGNLIALTPSSPV